MKNNSRFISGGKNSVILNGMDHFCKWVYDSIANGFLGRVMTSYSRETKWLEQSRIVELARHRSQNKGTNHSLQGVARAIEGSSILGFFERFSKGLLDAPVGAYGLFFLLFGLYSVATYFLDIYLGFSTSDISIYVGIICAIISLPMFAVTVSLGRLLQSSRLVSWLAQKLFGLNVVARDVPSKKSYLIALISSVVLGLLSIWIVPQKLLLVCVYIIVVCLTLAHPETGTIVALLMAPFMILFNTKCTQLVVFIVLSFIGFLMKLFRGRRVFRLELMDIMVVFMTIAYLFSGLFSFGGISAFKDSLVFVSLILMYFLLVNLMRTPEWLERVRFALILPGIPAVVLFLISTILKAVDINSSIVDSVGVIRTILQLSSNRMDIMAGYLVVLSVLVLGEIMKQNNNTYKTSYGALYFLIVVGIFTTWSRSAWFGWLISTLLFMLLNYWTTLRFILWGILPTGVLITFTDYYTKNSKNLMAVGIQSLFSRVLGTSAASLTSTQYRHSIWSGVGKMLKRYWYCGIGTGLQAFSKVYPTYAEIGMESVLHSHNLYLQTIVEMGILGLVLFLVTIFIFVQFCFEYLENVKDFGFRLQVSAGVCSVIAILLMGFSNYMWYGNWLFFLFWSIIGYEVASIRCDSQEKERMVTGQNGSAQEYDVMYVSHS